MQPFLGLLVSLMRNSNYTLNDLSKASTAVKLHNKYHSGLRHDIQHNDTQHERLICDAQHNVTQHKFHSA
jgi:hypothetical protein